MKKYIICAILALSLYSKAFWNFNDLNNQIQDELKVLQQLKLDISNLQNQRYNLKEDIIKDAWGTITKWLADALLSSGQEKIDHEINSKIESYNAQLENFNLHRSKLDDEITRLKQLLDDGNNYFKVWDYSGAVEKYVEYLKDFPNDATIKLYTSQALNLIGSASMKKQYYDEAISSFKQSLDYNNRDFFANYGIGFSYYGKKDYENAQKYLQIAYDLDTDNNSIQSIGLLLKESIDAQKPKEIVVPNLQVSVLWTSKPSTSWNSDTGLIIFNKIKERINTYPANKRDSLFKIVKNALVKKRTLKNVEFINSILAHIENEINNLKTLTNEWIKIEK